MHAERHDGWHLSATLVKLFLTAVLADIQFIHASQSECLNASAVTRALRSIIDALHDDVRVVAWTLATIGNVHHCDVNEGLCFPVPCHLV
jgi:ethanolamine ammonia-lyase small subunit